MAADVAFAAATGAGFLETFDGSPAAPAPARLDGWDTTVHALGSGAVSPMRASHGPDCAAPPAVHQVNGDPDDYVYRCKDHVMTALADSGHVMLVPPALLDLSQGEAVLRFDVSTLRTSSRDWINVQLFAPDDVYRMTGSFGRHTANGLQISMVHATDYPLWDAHLYRDGADTQLPGTGAPSMITFLPGGLSAARRDTFEVRLSRTHLKYGMPAYNVWFIDADLPGGPLPYDAVAVGLHQQGYSPAKDCPDGVFGEDCSPGSWHWDNVALTPSRPLPIARLGPRAVTAPDADVALPAPAPAGGASLRYWTPDLQPLDASFDGGATWRAAAVEGDPGNPEHPKGWRVPVPAGATRVRFRRTDAFRDFAVRDAHVWGVAATGPVALPPPPTATATVLPPTATALPPTATPAPAPAPATATAVPAAPTASPGPGPGPGPGPAPPPPPDPTKAPPSAVDVACSLAERVLTCVLPE